MVVLCSELSIICSLLIAALIGGSAAFPDDASSLAPPPPPPSVQQPQQPQQQQPPQEAAGGYVPHAVYPYVDRFGPTFEGYLYPAPTYPVQPMPYMSSLIPAAQQALQVALKLFAKVGLFLIGGVALLLIGGVFTTAVCSLTPICTITFAGLGGLDKDTMRSLMTPDNISATAALVKDAIGKYQNLQRTISV